MPTKLNIAITADPELPVPPVFYGGIERVIDALIQGCRAEGHTVSLFAHQDSTARAHLYPYAGKRSDSLTDFIMNSWLINKTVTRGDFDLVHSFGRLAYLLPQLPRSLPKLMSYQRRPELSGIKRAAGLARQRSLVFTGCSDWISRQIRPFAPAFTVYNSVDLKNFTYVPYVDHNAPLVFLGRIEWIKGPHLAIRVARQASMPLILAGNIPSGQESYFRREIEPQIDGDQVRYIGPVDDKQKNQLLGASKALLMPILWDEPFGIVMAEAMACGTPVLALRRGSVPEIVIDGVNGFSAASSDELLLRVRQIDEVDRAKVYLDCRQRFSSEQMVRSYIELYTKMLNRA